MTTQLILGGTGFIGSHLAKALAVKGHNVIAVGRQATAVLEAFGVEQRQIDLYACSQAELEELIASADVIHHLAWSTFAATAELEPDDDLRANVGFTVRLLQAARYRAPKIVFYSSGGTVYGRSQDVTISEDHPLWPVTAHGAGKVAAETYVDMYRRVHGLDIRIARLANPYGPGQSLKRKQGALSRFTALAVAGVELEIWGDGSVVRDYLHIDDAVRALLRLTEAPSKELGPVPVFNIGSGLGTSLNDIVSLLSDVLGRSIPTCYKAGRQVDVPRNVLSIERAARVLNWQPTLDLRDGVIKLISDLAQPTV